MAVWRRCEDVAVVDSGDRVVVLNLADATGSVPRLLDGSGGDIWRLIDGLRAEPELISELADFYGVTVAEIAEDVRAFLGQLESEGLVTSVMAARGGSR